MIVYHLSLRSMFLNLILSTSNNHILLEAILIQMLIWKMNLSLLFTLKSIISLMKIVHLMRILLNRQLIIILWIEVSNINRQCMKESNKSFKSILMMKKIALLRRIKMLLSMKCQYRKRMWSKCRHKREKKLRSKEFS